MTNGSLKRLLYARKSLENDKQKFFIREKCETVDE